MKLPEKFLWNLHNLKVLNNNREHNRLDAFVDHRQLVEAVEAVKKASKEDQGEDDQAAALAKLSGVIATFGTVKHRGVTEALEHLHPLRRSLKALADESNTLSRGKELSERIRKTLAAIAVYAGGAYRRLTARGEAVEAAIRMRI